MPDARRYDLIVAGSGIVGASIAWHAARAGLSVAVLDRSGPAAGASGASDGAVSVASKRPGLMAGLAGASLSYTADLSGGGRVLNGIFHPRPSFFLASDAAESAALDRLVQMLRGQGLPVTVLSDTSAGAASVPGLGASVLRVLELRGEGHMLGYRATLAFLRGSQCACHWPCALLGHEMSRDDVLVQTSRGEMRAGHLVVATGMGTAALAPDLPLIARSGQLIVTDRGTGRPVLHGPLTSAAYLLDKSAPAPLRTGVPVVLDPLATGQFLIGSSREDHGTETRTDFVTVRRILESGVRCLPALAERRILRVFAGVRTATGDGLPIVGPRAGNRRVIFATGFEGDGICLSALVGREVAQLVTDGTMMGGFAALSPDRFTPQKAASA